jgi:hypothetical protein
MIWAGFIEAFLSQYHEPTIPYEAKIAFGVTELFLLCLFLVKSGRKTPALENPDSESPFVKAEVQSAKGTSP